MEATLTEPIRLIIFYIKLCICIGRIQTQIVSKDLSAVVDQILIVIK